MSTATPPAGGYRYEDEQGHGWITFAGVLILIIGVTNAIQGIAAISQAHFYVGNAHYVFADLKTWGWIVLIIGVIEILVGLGVFARNQLARWTGVVVLGLNSLAQLLMMPAYPFWSLCIFALNTLAIYGLLVYGWRLER
jgi:uncharacterized membrane protein HdeD (DUF308 family)